MPILTTSVNLAPVDEAILPERTPLGEILDAAEHLVDVGHDILAVNDHRRVGAVTQRRMQHRTLLGGVDHGAGEHGIAPLGHARRLGELDQQTEGVGVEAVLREVEQHVVEAHAEAVEATGVFGEQLAHRAIGQLGLLGFQTLEDRIQLSDHVHALPCRAIARLRSVDWGGILGRLMRQG